MTRFKKPLFLIGFSIISAAFLASGLTLSEASGEHGRKQSSKGKTSAAAVSDNNAGPGAAFTPGNLVIYRVGDGVAGLSGVATAVFLDEYTPSGTLVQTIPMPTTASGGNNILTAAGSSTSEGFLSRSENGAYLLLGGYNKAPGGTAPNSDTPATTARVIGRVNSSGSVDTSTALNDPTGNIRGVASDNGSNLWLTSSLNGIRHALFGTVGGSTQLSTTVTNVRVPAVFGGQLFVSTSSGTAIRIGTVGTGLPTTAGQTITNLPNFPTTGGPYGYFLADLDSGVAGVDTLYVADDAANAVLKYSLVAGAWTLNNSVAIATARGLTGVVVGTTVNLYVTNGSAMHSLQDSAGYNASINGTPASVASAPTNTAFRGIAVAPTGGVVPDGRIDLNGDGSTDYLITREQGGGFAANSALATPSTRTRLTGRERQKARMDGSSLQQADGVPREWWGLNSTLDAYLGATWGFAFPDEPLVGDFDGDGKDDLTVWRPAVDGVEAYFYSLNSSDFTLREQQFGIENDNPWVVADYDGDGIDDPAVFRCPIFVPDQCYYYYRGSLNNPNRDIHFIPFGNGIKDDFLVYPGDFNGDGKADFGLQTAADFNPDLGVFWWMNNGEFQFNGLQWGLLTDRLVPGDFNGDGRSDFTVTRVINGSLWWFVLEQGGGIQMEQWGDGLDFEAPGDYNGDGRDDFAVYRWEESSATFWVKYSGSGAYTAVTWGLPGDFPVAFFYVQ